MANITNAEIKHIRSLSQKKFRDETGLFVVEGEKMVSEAQKSGFEVVSVYKKDEIGEESMSRISQLSTPSPVLAVVRKPSKSADVSKLFENGGFFLALDTIRDPGNLGTILRIADWYGVDAVFATQDTVDLFNPKVVQSTMGAIFRVKFYVVDLPAIATSILKCGGKVYGTFLDGENMYCKNLSTGDDCPVMLVIGNESNGISKQMGELVSDRLYLPPYPENDPGSESLNAAVATAIAVSEFRRRLTQK